MKTILFFYEYLILVVSFCVGIVTEKFIIHREKVEEKNRLPVLKYLVLVTIFIFFIGALHLRSIIYYPLLLVLLILIVNLLLLLPSFKSKKKESIKKYVVDYLNIAFVAYIAPIAMYLVNLSALYLFIIGLESSILKNLKSGTSRRKKVIKINKWKQEIIMILIVSIFFLFGVYVNHILIQ